MNRNKNEIKSANIHTHTVIKEATHFPLEGLEQIENQNHNFHLTHIKSGFVFHTISVGRSLFRCSECVQ